MITITQLNPLPEAIFKVTVAGEQITTHEVTLRQADYERLQRGEEEPEALLRRSFEFLLEREPNTSILSSFDLPLIGTYFPEFNKLNIDRV